MKTWRDKCTERAGPSELAENGDNNETKLRHKTRVQKVPLNPENTVLL